MKISAWVHYMFSSVLIVGGILSFLAGRAGKSFSVSMTGNDARAYAILCFSLGIYYLIITLRRQKNREDT